MDTFSLIINIVENVYSQGVLKCKLTIYSISAFCIEITNGSLGWNMYATRRFWP